MESLIHDVRIFNGILSNVIGLKLAGSEVLPFLWINIVHALFHSFGISPDSYTTLITSVMKDLR